jgi:UDP-glucose:(heptosyl)LPS alpha-1,3-glucosyltransferase
MKGMIGGRHDAAGRGTPTTGPVGQRTRSSGSGTRLPLVALVAWKLGDELVRAIREGGDRFRFVVVSMLLPDDVRPLVEWHPMPHLQNRSFRVEWATFYVRAGHRLARLHADLVHSVGPTPVVPNRVDVNTVTFCHAAYHEAAGPEQIAGTAFGWQIGEPIARLLERWWFERRVRVLAGLSEGGAADLRRHYPGAQVVVLPRGLDLERFRPDREARAALRRELAVGSDEVIALFVDQDRRPLKGLELAIEGFAAAMRSGRGPDRLWVLGSGNESYATLVRRMGVEPDVRFLGYRDDLERFYQAADVFVLPTAFETFSRSAHEAAACGLPVVAPPVSGIRALIGRDEAGIVVTRDASSVAQALGALAGDADLRARLAVEARRRASAFDIGSAARTTLDLYQSLLRSSGGPAGRCRS